VWPAAKQKSQTTAMCIASVQQDGRLALRTVSPTEPESRIISRIETERLSLRWVPKQTERMCYIAVCRCSLELQYVQEPTPEICMAAVRRSGYALRHVKEQTPELCLAAVRNTPFALRLVEEQTAEICLCAVRQAGSVVQYVKEQTPEICKAAVEQDPRAIRHVKKQTPELCELAVCSGCALHYVREHTEELCELAVRSRPSNLPAVRALSFGLLCSVARSERFSRLLFSSRARYRDGELWRNGGCYLAAFLVASSGRSLSTASVVCDILPNGAELGKIAAFDPNRFSCSCRLADGRRRVQVRKGGRRG